MKKSFGVNGLHKTCTPLSIWYRVHLTAKPQNSKVRRDKEDYLNQSLHYTDEDILFSFFSCYVTSGTETPFS